MGHSPVEWEGWGYDDWTYGPVKGVNNFVAGVWFGGFHGVAAAKMRSPDEDF